MYVYACIYNSLINIFNILSIYTHVCVCISVYIYSCSYWINIIHLQIGKNHRIRFFVIYFMSIKDKLVTDTNDILLQINP